MGIDWKGKEFRCRAAMIAVFLVAVGVRLWWVTAVQPPSQTIFSDMRSYMLRAVYLLDGEQEINEERKLDTVLFPYGVHYLYAAQLWLFGDADEDLSARAKYRFAGERLWGMSLVHALLSALTVLFAMMTARRCFDTIVAPVAVGVLLAVWQPLVSYVGFFSSEVPYAFFISLALWLWIRYAQTGRGVVWAGLITALGITIRPQLLLTGILFLLWLVVRRDSVRQFKWQHLAWFSIPIVLVLAFSTVRFHHFTGRMGLVSDNGAIARFFASTDYARIQANQGRKFQPPARSERRGFEGEFRFDSYISDAKPLNEERARIWDQKSISQKLGTWRRNMMMLFDNNTLWPERNAAKYAGLYARLLERKELDKSAMSSSAKKRILNETERRAVAEAQRSKSWRRSISTLWRKIALYGVFPLALLALIYMVVFGNLGIEIVALYFVSMLVTAIFFFGELRYRVPYDPALVILAMLPLVLLAERRLKRPDQHPFLRYAALTAVLLLGFLLLPWSW